MGWVDPAHPTSAHEAADEVEIAWSLHKPFWGKAVANEGGRGRGAPRIPGSTT